MSPIKNPITAWSYSRLTVFEKCPRLFKYKFIDKLPQKENYATSRGSLIHAKAEQFVKGSIRGIPKELKPFAAEFRELKRINADTEIDLSVTKAWEPTHTKDWTGVWLRALADSLVREGHEATTIDYKSGKIYDSHEEQGELYATCTFAHFPEVEVVDVEMWYLDQEDIVGWSYERDNFEEMKKKWNKRATPMFRERNFDPCFGNHCQWCDFKLNCEKDGT